MPHCLYCAAETPSSGDGGLVCRNCLEREWKRLREQSQSSLADFLTTEVNAACTLIQVAKVATEEKHMEHAHAASERSRNAVAAIRKLSRHLQDPDTLQRVLKAADELEDAIRLVEAGRQ